MAADGAATRAIGRALGCTTGTASKWRMRYAKDRLAVFSEVGDRGAAAMYGEERDPRILALLDAAPSEGCANWTGPLIARALGDVHIQYVRRFLRAQKIDRSGRKSCRPCENSAAHCVLLKFRGLQPHRAEKLAKIGSLRNRTEPRVEFSHGLPGVKVATRNLRPRPPRS